MAQRTTKPTVMAILGSDYDGVRDLQVFINTATKFVDRVVTLALTYSVLGPLDDTPTTGAATDLEGWVAAHLYAVSDKPLQSKSSGKASGQFSGQTGMGFDSTLYGQHALRIDYTGVLNAIDKRKLAGAGWLGLYPSDQTDYEDKR